MLREQNRHSITLRTRLLMAILWLLAVGTTASAEPMRWGYQPTYNDGATAPITVRFSNANVQGSGSSYALSASGYTGGLSYSTTTGQAKGPSYTFRTTSAYIPSSIKAYTPVASSGKSARKSGNPWDTTPGEDDDPIGVTPDPVPVGDAMWLMLLFALLYGAYRYTQKKRLA